MTFAVLLPIVILIYYIVPPRIRQYYLLLVNLCFYAGFGWKNVFIILTEAIIAYTGGLLIGSKERKHNSLILAVFVVIVAAFIPVFKLLPRLFSYYSLIVPLGLSFFTLQAISYLSDVRTGIVKCEHDPLKLLTWLTFFPTITSGPIYRYKDFISEHEHVTSELNPDYFRITNGIIYLLYGLFLKLVIAERAAVPVNAVFSDHQRAGYGGMILFIIAVTYSVQLYADFAGYSAIVIGIAQIIGYDIPENFKAPYLSLNIKEFWSRWHISLSSWLRDYIYIPLGGNRKGRGRKYINIMITFFISGLWHGLYGHFFIWGGLHGIYQIIGNSTQNIRMKMLSILGIKEDTAFFRFCSRLITFFLVTFAWLFFRTGIADALAYIKEIFTYSGMDEMMAGRLWETGLSPFWWIALGIFTVVMFLNDLMLYKYDRRIDALIESQGAFAKALIVIVLCLTILILGIYGDQHTSSYFVYSEF